jgi:sensor c-di-GMP phosphodiesterase-like protein
MNRKCRQRVLVAKVVTIALSACGLVAGYLLGSAISLVVATHRLDQYAMLTAAQSDASYAEARSVLNALKVSQYNYCSDAEIAFFRGLVFHSQYLKDAGRIRGGKIDCSATAGHPVRSIGLVKPDSRQNDGTIAYSDFTPLRDAGLKRSALQLGTAYVAFDSQLPASPGPIPMQLSATMKDAALMQSSPPGSKASWNRELNLTADGAARLGDTLYATRCSTLRFNCVTASTSVSEASHGEFPIIAGSTAAGGLSGILLGVLIALVLTRKRDLCQQLRGAIQRDELQLVYQPIVVLSTRQIVGAEALARWTDEDGNAVDPEVFVQMAEQRGIVGALTKAVLQHALHDFAKTLQSRPGFRLSVNVAGADLVDPEFLPMLDDSLKQAKVNPEGVVIEISEKSAGKSQVAMETIRILRRMGHSIHIDDFGTGYSNLDKLLYLFADTIKIDKAFTGVIGTESVAVAILPQILAMAKSLNLEVVVEGVETDHQADYFSQDTPRLYGQGWLYGHPVSAEDFHILLAGNLAAVLATQSSTAQTLFTWELEAEWAAKPGALHIVGGNAA